jgi:hypothetical protein
MEMDMKRARPEEQLHRAVAAWLRVALPAPWMFWHSPNGGGRSKAEAGIFKAMGVRAGIPDLFIIGPGHVDVGRGFSVGAPCMICIEFKAPKPARSSLSPAQRDTINALSVLGIPTIIARSIDEAERELRALGVPLKGRCL